MRKFVSKYLNYLLTGSFSVVFAACYGAPVKLENPKLINVKDINEQAIPGLKVTVIEDQEKISEQYTNTEGAVEVYFVQKVDKNYKAIIEDVDGIENFGDFQTKEIDITNDSFFDLNMDKKE